MIEYIIFIAHLEARYSMERDKRWNEQFLLATSEEKKVMLEKREEEKKERIIERRHQEQIQAQEKLAAAIRFHAILQ